MNTQKTTVVINEVISRREKLNHHTKGCMCRPAASVSQFRVLLSHFCSQEGVSAGWLRTPFNCPWHDSCGSHGPKHSATSSQSDVGGSLSSPSAAIFIFLRRHCRCFLAAACRLGLWSLTHNGCLIYAIHMQLYTQLYNESIIGLIALSYTIVVASMWREHSHIISLLCIKWKMGSCMLSSQIWWDSQLSEDRDCILFFSYPCLSFSPTSPPLLPPTSSSFSSSSIILSWRYPVED